MKLLILATLAVPALVAAQYAPPPDNPTTTAAVVPTATAGQHIVSVAVGNAFTFSPSSTSAKVNETVSFVFTTDTQFMHSVTQSSFDNPCTPLQGGFNSGLINPGSEFTLNITGTDPIWFYCEQTNPEKHCGMGMVGVINPPSSGNTFSAFAAKASSIGNNEGAQTASPALTGSGAFATASASALPKSSGSSGASRVTVNAGVALAAALYALS